jgi:hypothetical protein
MHRSNRARWRRAVALAVIGPLALLSATAHAVKTSGGEFNTLYAGLGIKGYDPVAYFTDDAPILGHEEFTYEYGGCDVAICIAGAPRHVCRKSCEVRAAIRRLLFVGRRRSKPTVRCRPGQRVDRLRRQALPELQCDINTTFNKNPSALILKANHNWPALNQ